MTEAMCRTVPIIPGYNFIARKIQFKKYVTNGLWKKSSHLADNTKDRFIPMICCQTSLTSLFPASGPDPEKLYPERLHHKDLDDYLHGDPNRGANVSVMIAYHESIEKSHAAGRKSVGLCDVADLAKKAREKLQVNEANAERLLAKIHNEVEAQTGPQDSTDICNRNVQYQTKYDRRSRRMVVGCALQSLTRAMQAVAAPDVEEWDVVKAMFTYIVKIADKLKAMLEHETAHFPAIKFYVNDPDDVCALLLLDQAETKKVCNAVFNGMRIPSKFINVGFLKNFRNEGRLFRWIACSIDPAFHSMVIELG
jgi:hypothetical protein